ncbi:MAG: pyridoxamine 5'-phosphate oxidase family protein, partial [Clostridia bacterium]|nr:pyridoxamine 5'-phosphate oxidase family protein [Clostridia bacterium]
MEKLNETTAALMEKRFGHDNLIALATTAGDLPQVRAVNAYYENGSFYIITYARSGKMTQLA